MPEAISNTSPLLYLHRVDVLEWLPQLFTEVWLPGAVATELAQGRQSGYDVPSPESSAWARVVEPRMIPSEWLALDLGRGELATMALALENPGHVVLLDDALARQIAQAAGLEVWGTLRIVLEAKSRGFTESVKPFVDRLQDAGMWISDSIRQRILALARESE